MQCTRNSIKFPDIMREGYNIAFVRNSSFEAGSQGTKTLVYRLIIANSKESSKTNL